MVRVKDDRLGTVHSCLVNSNVNHSKQEERCDVTQRHEVGLHEAKHESRGDAAFTYHVVTLSPLCPRRKLTKRVVKTWIRIKLIHMISFHLTSDWLVPKSIDQIRLQLLSIDFIANNQQHINEICAILNIRLITSNDRLFGIQSSTPTRIHNPILFIDTSTMLNRTMLIC